MVMVRAAALVLALLCCVWFAIGVRQSVNLSRATSIVSQQSRLTPAQVRRTQSLLNHAAALNPDQQVNVVRGEVAIEEGENARARLILHAVVHREVNDLQAWLMYARASSDDLIQNYAAQYVINRLVRTFPAQR